MKKINIKKLNFLESKKIHLILFIIIIIQFFIVITLLLEFKKSKYFLEQSNSKSIEILGQLKQADEKINSLQSNVSRISAQLFRIQAENNN